MRHTALIPGIRRDGAAAGVAGVTWVDGVTIRGARPDGSAEEIRFRPALRNRLVQLLAGPIGVLCGTGAFLVTQHGDIASLQFVRDVAGPMLATLVGAGSVHLVNSQGVTLTPGALVVHRFGKPRRVVPWAEIEGLSIRSVLSAEQIVLHRTGGRRRIRLAIPSGGFLGDPAFLTKYHTIGAWWLAGRQEPRF